MALDKVDFGRKIKIGERRLLDLHAIKNTAKIFGNLKIYKFVTTK